MSTERFLAVIAVIFAILFLALIGERAAKCEAENIPRCWSGPTFSAPGRVG